MAKCKLFVSYNSSDSVYYNLLKAWLQEDKYDFCNEKTANTKKADEACEERVKKADCFLYIVSENSKELSPYQRAELDSCFDSDIPIIAINVNGLRYCDQNLCPQALQRRLVLHVSFNREIIIQAIEIWPGFYSENKVGRIGPVRFSESVYHK